MSEASDNDRQWRELLDELERRQRAARALGGTDKIARQHARGRLDVRARLDALYDAGSFVEYGSLAGGCPPDGGAPVPADGVVTGVGTIGGRTVAAMAEDFTIQGGSIGHVGHAKRSRIVTLAAERSLPLVLLLDGAGERASNALERYAFAPNDLQLLADLRGRVPVVALVLGASAGHGALSGLFADFIVMTDGAALFTAGPPLVKAAIGVDVDPETLGGADVHVRTSGVAHNRAGDEPGAFALARTFFDLVLSPDHAGDPGAHDEGPRRIEAMLELVPRNVHRPYDVRDVVASIADADSVLELQPEFGGAMVTALVRLGGRTTLVVANQPSVMAGSITRDASEKATHFLRVAAHHRLPVVFLADNPGVLAGPEAERAGTIRAAAEMFVAQRALRSTKIHVTLRRAFGFGSSLMGMNPFDRQTVSLAFPGIALGGVPAASGAEAAGADDSLAAQLDSNQQAAWSAADNNSYDRVIDPRNLRNEILLALADG